MARSFGLPRFAAGLAGVSLAAALAAACGGSDFIDEPDAAHPDGVAPDGETPDGQTADGTMPDAGADADATSLDAADGASPDGSQMDGTSPDSESADADGGAIGAEGSLDAAPEAALDATVDGSEDASLDAQVDSSLEASLDGSLDTSVDVSLDVEPDVSLDASLDGPSDAQAEAEAQADAFDSGTSGLMQSLFTATPFVVLGGGTVTNSGVATVLLGDVGTTGPSITGLTGPPFQPSGTTDIGNAVATQAVTDLGTAYVSLTGQACPPANALTGQDLGGMTLAPGVYCFTSSAGQIASTVLTFDAKNDPNAVWIIQVKTALTVLDGASAIIINGPPTLACRIFWAMGTAATLNGNTHMLGTMLASSQTSMLDGASLSPGRAFGISGGVTLLSNTVSISTCP
jgi:hypothetical protein